MTEGQAVAYAAPFRARPDAIAIKSGGDPCAVPDEVVTIGTLKPGQSGYTVPWAFSDEYPVFAGECGAASMPIGRNDAGELWVGSESLTLVAMATRVKAASNG